MLTKLVRLLKWLFLPETLPPPSEEPPRKAGLFAWLISQESLDGARFRTVEPEKKKSFFGWLFARERLDTEAPPQTRKPRSLVAWLLSRENL